MRHARRTLAPTGARYLVATLLACAGATTALADDYSWIAGSGSWGNPSHWAPFGLPGPADFARIGNIAGIADHTVFADREVTVLGLFLSDGMGYQNEGWRTTVLGVTHIDADARIFLTDAVDGSDLVTQRMTLAGSNARIFLEDSMLRAHDTGHRSQALDAYRNADALDPDNPLYAEFAAPISRRAETLGRIGGYQPPASRTRSIRTAPSPPWREGQ